MGFFMQNPTLKNIDRKEAFSFLGYRNYPQVIPDCEILSLTDKYEDFLLKCIKPRYIFKMFGPNELSDILIGNDISNHVKNCEKIILMCATLGGEVDKIIREAEVSNITGAVILDALAGAAIEQICCICEKEIKASYPNKHITERYSPGYGDFPIKLQSEFLNKLDANRKIGLFANENNILIPRKSVTAVVGIRNYP